jgi:hypothetical protein
MDPEQPCSNPDLTYSVVPTPGDAQIAPNSPCEPIELVREMIVCGFGAPASAAANPVALVGDSHAGHWRAALEVVAQTKGWHGISIMRSGCPLSKAIKRLPGAARGQCVRWNRLVLKWFAKHPEVGTVFVTQATSRKGVIVRRGQHSFPAEVAGYQGAWRALPASVKHIVVIRDTPTVHYNTLDCIARAMSRRQRAGLVCAVPRRSAVKPDPAAVAAAQLQSPRVQTVDLNNFVCDNALCYPVIGGALVYKDSIHFTSVFATTLGPYLLRAVGRLVGFSG